MKTKFFSFFPQTEQARYREENAKKYAYAGIIGTILLPIVVLIPTMIGTMIANKLGLIA